MNQPQDMRAYVQKLKQHQLRTTIPRLQVLKILEQAGEALTAYEIEHQSYNTGQHVTLSSVYNTLKTLEECGIVYCYKHENSKALYSLSPKHAPNRIICMQCGKITWLQDDALQATLQRLSQQYGFVMQDHALTINARCMCCQPL